MKKRGQIYIIASIILIAFIVGVVTISNNFKDANTIDSNVENMDLSIEFQKIIDANQDNPQETLKELIAFTDNYLETSTDSTDIYLLMRGEELLNKPTYFVIYDSSKKLTNLRVDNSRLSLLEDKFEQDDFSFSGQLGYLASTNLNNEKVITLITRDDSYNVNVGELGEFFYVIYIDVKGETHLIIKEANDVN